MEARLAARIHDVATGLADQSDAQAIRQAIYRRDQRITALTATVQDLAALLDRIVKADELGRTALPGQTVRLIQEARDRARAVAPTEG